MIVFSFVSQFRVTRASIGLVIMLLAGTSVWAASFNVNNTADVNDANPGNGICATAGGVCTLRAAIDEANALAGTDSILLPSGTYTVTNDLDITSTLNITGAATNTTIIDGGGNDRVFDMLAGANTTLTLMTIRNGDATTGGDGNDGGGIRNRDAVITLDRVIVRDNFARNGGGFLSRGSVSVVRITDSGFIDNQTTGRDGGGVYLRDGSVTADRATLEGNSARHGGGIFTQNGTRTFINVTISGNSSTRDGGGVFVRDGTVTFVNATFNV